MKYKKFLNQIEGLKKETEMSKQESLELKSLIMSKIDFGTVQEKVKTSFLVRLAENLAAQRLMLKPVATFSLVLVLFVVFSFATVNASNNTLPGNPLYNFKIAAEKTRYILAFSEESRAKMSLDIAKRRANEFTALVSRIDDNSTKESRNTVTYVSNQIKNHLTDVKDKFAKINSEEGSKKVLAMAEVINKDMDDIQEQINQVEDKNNTKDVLEEVGDVKLVVLAALVERQEAGDLDLSKEELEKEVEEQITKISDEVDQAVSDEDINKEQAELISENVEEAGELVGESLSESLEKVKEAKGLLETISNPVVKGRSAEIIIEDVITKEDEPEGRTSDDPIIEIKAEPVIDPFFSKEAWELEEEEETEEFEINIQ